jgi:hypothetical protein
MWLLLHWLLTLLLQCCQDRQLALVHMASVHARHTECMPCVLLLLLLQLQRRQLQRGHSRRQPQRLQQQHAVCGWLPAALCMGCCSDSCGWPAALHEAARC